MNISNCILYPGIVYSVLYLVDSAARHYLPRKYARFLRATGIEIGLFQVKWFTERFNRSLLRFGRLCPGLLSSWFLVGAITASLLIPVAIYILVKNLIREIGWNQNFPGESKSDELVIQPVLPGVNIPNSELGYYFVSLLLCSVYHELGHAVSAISENVRVLGFGVFVLFLIPAAYVDLPTDQLVTKSNLQKLRVFSAGVWHNIILVGWSYVLIASCPFLFSPVYTYGEHPCVIQVTANSSVTGPSGLKAGDVIIEMLGAQVTNRSQFRDNILTSIQSSSQGFCVNKNHLEQLLHDSRHEGKSDDLNCCSDHSNTAAASLCFHIHKELTEEPEPACLGARSLVTRAKTTCTGMTECPPSSVCAVPVFSANITKFIQISRKNDKDFLYVGNPALIYTSIQLSDFCPRYQFLPASLPEILTKLCSYMMSFSGALALLNVVPSLLLDGQHMIVVLLDILLVGRFEVYRKHFQIVLTIIGTLLVVINIGIGFYRVTVSGTPNILQ
eukprot:TRINITY_DN3679_c0_g1_i9.p1 TRINITY_DN3679_c0_g1~~TRINITY_DN3679_c0_g1_i9.p1  ORF type:complete len:501 (+),score=52.36 TRINITY_DN3679_c0_g1_i9:523-2025(+)